MAQITQTYEEALDYWSTWSQVFGNPNTTWLSFDQRLLMGNFFNGLQAQTQIAWNTQIPAGSTIISADVVGQPAANNFNLSFTATMNAPNRALLRQPQDPLQEPFNVFRGYRRGQWDNAQVGALSTTFTAVFGTSVTTNASFILRQLTVPGGTIPQRAHMAQRITTRTGNMTIASLFWDLSRNGNPPGSMRVRIQGITNDRGVTIPNGVDIAVSNDVLCSSVPNAQTLTIFTFASNPTLVPLTQYFILLEADYPASGTDSISVYHQNQFLSDGQEYSYGDGLGMDWQNHPGAVDLNQAYQLDPLAGQDVIWPINRTDLGIPEISPDITALVQAQIDAANYTPDAGIILTLSRFVPTSQNRRFASNTNVSRAGPILRLTYEEPIPPVAPDGMADPYTGPSRFREPFDRGYYLWKYGDKVLRQATRGYLTEDDPPERPEQVRSSFIFDAYREELERQAEALTDDLERQAADLNISRAEAKRDIRELELYIAQLTREIESDLLAKVAEQEAEQVRQQALIMRLEANRVAAREALLLVLERQRRRNSQLLAIESVIRFYF